MCESSIFIMWFSLLHKSKMPFFAVDIRRDPTCSTIMAMSKSYSLPIIFKTCKILRPTSAWLRTNMKWNVLGRRKLLSWRKLLLCLITFWVVQSLLFVHSKYRETRHLSSENKLTDQHEDNGKNISKLFMRKKCQVARHRYSYISSC